VADYVRDDQVRESTRLESMHVYNNVFRIKTNRFRNLDTHRLLDFQIKILRHKEIKNTYCIYRISAVKKIYVNQFVKYLEYITVYISLRTVA